MDLYMYFPQEIFRIIKEYLITEYYKLREFVSQNPEKIYKFFSNKENDKYINFIKNYSFHKTLTFNEEPDLYCKKKIKLPYPNIDKEFLYKNLNVKSDINNIIKIEWYIGGQHLIFLPVDFLIMSWWKILYKG